MKRLVSALVVAATFGASASVSAGLGDRIFALDPNTDVIASFETNGGAGFTNVLFVDSPRLIADIFNNQTTAPNTTFNLGRFGIGEEIVFRIDVYPSGLGGALEAQYFSGPASRNETGNFHASVIDIGDNVLRVGFEDLPSPDNYTDLVFTINNAVAVPVPEPETYAMLLAGLGIVGWAARRRCKR